MHGRRAAGTFNRTIGLRNNRMDEDSERETVRNTEPSDDSPVASNGNEPSNGEQLQIAVAVHLLVIASLIIAGDFMIYRAAGYTGLAVFLPLCALVVLPMQPHRRISGWVVVTVLMLAVLSVQLWWDGTFACAAAGFVLLFATALAIRGRPPFLIDTLLFGVGVIPGAVEYFQWIDRHYRGRILDPLDRGEPSRLITVALPILSAFAFGIIFVMANPELVAMASQFLSNVFETLRLFLFRFSIWEVLFWCGTAWFVGGLLRPHSAPVEARQQAVDTAVRPSLADATYSAFRNTLVTLIALFVVYLVFEFKTLWFREFPQGFYYAGYAHEGAAWLTVALGLSTVTLSLIFRGRTVTDDRVATLRRLAWCWSFLNLLLALAVFNRMYIYVVFNGMTRMRTFGLLGIAAVVAGFLLVLWKIHRNHNFRWLIRRQLWAPAVALYLWLVLPVDVLVNHYNAAQVMGGHLAPVVQMSEHPIGNAGLPQLIPLLQCDDQTIREGIQSFLWIRLRDLRQYRSDTDHAGWTARNGSVNYALSRLSDIESQLGTASDLKSRTESLERFRKYAYQWY
jgi:Domain of unknown function (DUF4153)